MAGPGTALGVIMANSTVAKLDRMSAEEYELRVDVAAAFRLLHRHGMSDLVAGNISARLPGADWFLTHPHGTFFEEMRASDLIKVDLEGNPLQGPDERVHYSAVRQGAFGFAARPELNVVLHAHGMPIMAVSALKRGILPISEWAFIFYKGVAHVEADFQFGDDYMNRVADALKDNRIVIYNNHAFLLAAETVAEAFLLAYMLNQACELQVKILSTGDPVITPDAEACERHYASYYGNPNARYDGSAEWPGLLRSLDRVDSSYRD